MSAVFTAYYFPPIRYMADFIQQESPIIDAYENMQKQTYRNRCYILGPNARQRLQVPIQKNNQSRKIKDIKISYTENWQKIHFKSLEAAYRRSPFFEFYEHIFQEILSSEHKYLLDLNVFIMERILNMLQLDSEINLSNAYSKTYDKDFRDQYNPKTDKVMIPKYSQVFEEKQEFVHNLSIIDLICNLGGSESNLYLKNLV